MKDRIKLRALTYNDIEKTLKWHNDKAIRDLYSGHPFFVNIEFEKKWYDKILNSNIPTTVFGVENVENGLLIGITILKNIDLVNRSAEFAQYIGDPEYRGMGLGKEMKLLTLKFAFDNLGLERVYGYIQENNKSSLILNQKLGFKKEGRLRKATFKEGRFIDVFVISILKNEFYKMVRKYEL